MNVESPRKNVTLTDAYSQKKKTKRGKFSLSKILLFKYYSTEYVYVEVLTDEETVCKFVVFV